MEAVKEVAPGASPGLLSRVLGISRATVYRRKGRRTGGVACIPDAPRPRPAPPRSLSGEERTQILSVLDSERFCDASPAECYHALLDEGTYLASERTMYRVLEAEGEIKERRNQLSHPDYWKPELLATRPNELWSWDVERH